MFNYPTIAELVLDDFTSRRVKSLTTYARKFAVEETRTFEGVVEFVFEDDTKLYIKGRGKAYKAWAELP